MGPWETAGILPSPSWDPPAWPGLAAALDWLPLASLLLAADGSALGVSRGWCVLSGLAAEDSRADGWVSAVEPLDRGVLRARLRDAALAGQAGCADFRLAGRWSRWWWRPGPSGRLIVCVADLGDCPGHDGQWQGDRHVPARLSAVQPGSHAATAEPPPPRPAADQAGHAWPDLAGMLVHGLFRIGLDLRSASALADGPAAARLQQALDQLNSIIQDTQTAAFGSQAPRHHNDGQD